MPVAFFRAASLLIFLAFLVFGQTLTINGNVGSVQINECSTLTADFDFMLNGTITGFASIQLYLNGALLQKRKDTFFNWSSPAPIHYSIKDIPWNGTYDGRFVLNGSAIVHFPPVQVTVVPAVPVCAQGTKDSTGNCFVVAKPIDGFIANNSFYRKGIAYCIAGTRVQSGPHSNACFVEKMPGGGAFIKVVGGLTNVYVPTGETMCSITHYTDEGPVTTQEFPVSIHAPDNTIKKACRIMSFPVGPYFVDAGNLYADLSFHCPSPLTDSAFDGAGCLVLKAPALTTALQAAGKWYLTPKPPCQ
jgi:hypothetical protein